MGILQQINWWNPSPHIRVCIFLRVELKTEDKLSKIISGPENCYKHDTRLSGYGIRSGMCLQKGTFDMTVWWTTLWGGSVWTGPDITENQWEVSGENQQYKQKR